MFASEVRANVTRRSLVAFVLPAIKFVKEIWYILLDLFVSFQVSDEFHYFSKAVWGKFIHNFLMLLTDKQQKQKHNHLPTGK